MILLYNDVPLDVTRLLAHDAECVYDESGTDLMYIRHRISVEALVGYGSQAFVAEDNPDRRKGKKAVRVDSNGLAAEASPPKKNEDKAKAIAKGQKKKPADKKLPARARIRKLHRVFGAESAAAIRHSLSQPRKTFALFDVSPDSDGPADSFETLLFSDGLDANNGPKPIGPVSVISVHGAGSLYFVRFDIEVCLNECPLFGAGQESPKPQPFGLLTIDDIPVFVSNRWTSSVMYAEKDAAVTYRIRGRATARSDALAAFGISSLDQFRGGLLPNPVKNCKRYIRQLDMSADGLSFEYTVDDVEQFRVYLDEPTPAPGRKPVKDPHVRNVESIDLVVEKSYAAPSVGKSLSRFVENFMTTTLAGGIVGQVTLGVAPAAVALAKTIDDDVIPTYSESATAKVQLSRYGRMQDAQALCFALISGALNYGNGRDPKRNGNQNWLLLPAQTLTLAYNPVEGWVQASLSIVRSGLLDFTLGQLKSSIATMIDPIDDSVVGGQLPFSLLNFAAALQGFEPLNLIDKNFWKKIKDALESAQNVLDFSVPGKEVLTRYTGNLLLTEKDAHVRGLTYDGVSRTAADVLLRTAAALLGQCDPPSASINKELPHLPRRSTGSRPTSMLPPQPTEPPTQSPTQSQAFAATATGSLKTFDQLIAEWNG
jgi:hypothetical protein